MWQCPRCETYNDGEKCIICGEPKPKDVVKKSQIKIYNEIAEKGTRVIDPNGTKKHKPIAEKKEERRKSQVPVIAIVIGIVVFVTVVAIGTVFLLNKANEGNSGEVLQSETETATEETESINEHEEIIETETVIAENEEDTIREAFEKYAVSIYSYDMETALECTTEYGLYEEMLKMGIKDFESLIKHNYKNAGIEELMPEDVYEEFIGVIADSCNEATEKMVVTVEDISINGDKAEAYARIESVNLNAVLGEEIAKRFKESITEDTDWKTFISTTKTVVSASVDMNNLDMREGWVEFEKVDGKWLVRE